jgi:N-acetylneuraminic acid mutarotase
MSVTRAAHTAVLLQDGLVLVAGGCCDPVPNGLLEWRTSELWDPATGQWASSGAMSNGHAFGTMHLLTDGTVLVVAGMNMGPNNARNFVDLYHPDTGTWTAVGDLGDMRSNYAAGVLAGNRVLATGGNQGGCCSGLATAELYDPSTQSWQVMPPMSHGRRDHAAAVLAGGTQLLVGGGYTFGNDPEPTHTSAEIFDVITRTWSLTASMAQARAGHTMTTLDDGSVLAVAGSVVNGGYLDSAERYRP